MTVAEQIKGVTDFNSKDRMLACTTHAVKNKVLLFGFTKRTISAYEFTFIDGSKLTCRVYW